jgi:hypothetical protein
LELVNACKSLPDFDTLQIVHFILGVPLYPGSLEEFSTERWNQEVRDQAKDVKGGAIDCLREPETGCQEGGGRKKTALRLIELRQDSRTFRLDSVKVEEYRV